MLQECQYVHVYGYMKLHKRPVCTGNAKKKM